MLSLSVVLSAYPCQKITCFLLPSWFYEDEQQTGINLIFVLPGNKRRSPGIEVVES